MKTNELFYRWFSEPERYEQIREIIHFIKTSGKMPKLSDLQTFKNVRIIFRDFLLIVFVSWLWG